MSKLLLRMRHSPRLTRVLFAVIAPTLFAIVMSPWWVGLVSIILAMASAIYVYAEILSPKFVHSRPHRQLKEEATPVPRVEENGPRTRLHDPALPSPDWLSYAQQVMFTANNAQSEIHSTVRLSLRSALALSNCIQELERNHDTQNHLARSLLETTTERSNFDASLSDLATAAAQILDRQNQQLLSTADHAELLIEQQKVVLQITAKADELLGEADKAARQLALKTMSGGLGSRDPSEAQGKIHPLSFAQDYRNTLLQLRDDLNDIRRSLGNVTNELQNKVSSLRNVAHRESAEVSSLTLSIQKKLNETSSTVSALSELSKDTDSHIQAAIIAMQYHDITTQKMSALDALHLEPLATSTRIMLRQLGHEQDSTDQTPTDHANRKPESTGNLSRTSNEVDLFV
jgi:hypothetical protein